MCMTLPLSCGAYWEPALKRGRRLSEGDAYPVLSISDAGLIRGNAVSKRY